jgi:hypothetical protein
MGAARYYPSSFDAQPSAAPDVRNIASMAVSVAILSAFSVFFVLCERDSTFLLQATQPEHAAHTIHPTSTSEVSVALPASSVPPSPGAPEASTHPVPAQPTNIPFTVGRSRHFQQVGPIRIGFWRTDAKGRYYDLSVILNGRRFNGKHIALDQPVSIPTDAHSTPLRLIVNKISRTQISGYVSEAAQAEEKSR